MVRWAYIPLMLFGSVTYTIRIWIRIPRSKVLHSCMQYWFADKHILRVKSLPTKGQDKKKKKREYKFYFMPFALTSVETDLRDYLGLKMK